MEHYVQSLAKKESLATKICIYQPNVIGVEERLVCLRERFLERAEAYENPMITERYNIASIVAKIYLYRCSLTKKNIQSTLKDCFFSGKHSKLSENQSDFVILIANFRPSTTFRLPILLKNNNNKLKSKTIFSSFFYY